MTNGGFDPRTDPIFKLRTPLLFAHRGGAKEVPESTEEAFEHAVRYGADVLELDLRLSLDGKPIVWHGPGLKNVRGKRKKYGRADHIGEYDWAKLKDKAWVLHPVDEPKFIPRCKRRLLTLGDFFKVVERLENKLKAAGTPRTIHINIELKRPHQDSPGWTCEILNDLLDIVDEQANRRTIILASMNLRRLKKLRLRMEIRKTKRHPTNLTFSEQVSYPASVKDPSATYAYETSYAVLNRTLVRKVRRRGDSLYVFLTGFGLIPAMDKKKGKALEKQLVKLLRKGVDGIMTDYPKKVGELLQEWREAN